MTPRTRRGLLFAAALALTLAGCAGKEEAPSADADEVDNGPTFLVEGRLSVKRTGRPPVLGTFTWSRGKGPNGWVESIRVFDPYGRQQTFILSDRTGTSVELIGRGRRDYDSLEKVLRKELGLDIPLRVLAGWVVNEHAGASLGQDVVSHGTARMQVLGRHPDGRPERMRIFHRDTVLLVVVTNLQD